MVTAEDGRAFTTLPILPIDRCVLIAFSFNKKLWQFRVISDIAVSIVTELYWNCWNMIVSEMSCLISTHLPRRQFDQGHLILEGLTSHISSIIKFYDLY